MEIADTLCLLFLGSIEIPLAVYYSEYLSEVGSLCLEVWMNDCLSENFSFLCSIAIPGDPHFTEVHFYLC